MEYLHANDIIRRYMKTDNVLIRSRNQIDAMTVKWTTDFWSHAVSSTCQRRPAPACGMRNMNLHRSGDGVDELDILGV